MTFDDMMVLAKQTLATMEEHPDRLPAPLVYVLLASDGRVWTVRNDAPWTGDAVISRVVAVWKEGSVDVPSYAFRKALLESNGQNADAEVLLNTSIGLRTRKMGELF